VKNHSKALNNLMATKATEDEQFGLIQSFVLGADFPDMPKLNHDHTAVIVSASVLENGLAPALSKRFVTLEANIAYPSAVIGTAVPFETVLTDLLGRRSFVCRPTMKLVVSRGDTMTPPAKLAAMTAASTFGE
jgi:hypothetical protein